MATRPSRVLIAVEGSPASDDAVAYAADVLARVPDVRLYVVHVVGPLPDALRTAPDAPVTDERRDAQAAWMSTAREVAKLLLGGVAQRLEAAGFPAGTVATRVAELAGSDVAATILESARDLDCDTIVVGREAISWVPQLHYPHVGENLVRAAKDVTVWIVG